MKISAFGTRTNQPLIVANSRVFHAANRSNNLRRWRDGRQETTRSRGGTVLEHNWEFAGLDLSQQTNGTAQEYLCRNKAAMAETLRCVGPLNGVRSSRTGKRERTLPDVNVNETVLYAEDDENDAFFMQRAFLKNKRAGQLRVVPNGRRAVEYLAGAGEFANRTRFPLPGVVLLDVKMPEMSGLEALNWIRTRHEFDAVVVLIFTSSTQESDVEFSRTHGATGYFVKPSNAETLGGLVANIQRATEALPLGSPILEIKGNQL